MEWNTNFVVFCFISIAVIFLLIGWWIGKSRNFAKQQDDTEGLPDVPFIVIFFDENSILLEEVTTKVEKQRFLIAKETHQGTELKVGMQVGLYKGEADGKLESETIKPVGFPPIVSIRSYPVS